MKEDHVAARVGDLVDHRLQAFLELPAVLRPGDDAGQVANVLSKLDLRSRARAVVFAYEHGLARPGR